MGCGSAAATELRITALDLGATTGLASGEAGRFPHVRSITLTGDKAERGAELYRILQKHLTEIAPDVLYIEAAPPLAGMMRKGTSMEALQTLYGYEAIAMLAGTHADIPVKLVDVQRARQHFLRRKPPRGKGKDMVAHRCRVLRWPAANHNESDALCVWDFACAHEAPSRWMKAVQQHAAH